MVKTSKFCSWLDLTLKVSQIPQYSKASLASLITATKFLSTVLCLHSKHQYTTEMVKAF